jgi:hypothetical protein
MGVFQCANELMCVYANDLMTNAPMINIHGYLWVYFKSISSIGLRKTHIQKYGF